MKNEIMKTIKTLIFLLILALSFSKLQAQADLNGTWKASCFLERNSNGSLKFCGICPIQMKDDKSLQVLDFQIIVKDMVLTLKLKNENVKCSYQLNDTLDMVSFDYKNTNYNFKVLSGNSDSNRMLKSDCGVILLSRK